MFFRYLRPNSVDEALAMLGEHRGAAMPVAGCTNFTPDFRAGKAHPDFVVDISGLPLRSIALQDGCVRIGALSTVTSLIQHPGLCGWAPVMVEAAEKFAGHLVRNRATVGGNLVDASPAADLAPPLLALGAEVTLLSVARGSRTLPLDQFMLGVRHTARQPDELLTEVAFPRMAAGSRCSYFKFALRGAMAISVVSGAMVLNFVGDTCTAVRVGLGAVAPKPVRAASVEAKLVGCHVTEGVAATAAAEVGADISPISDVRASAEYRRLVAEAMLRRHLLAASTQTA